MVRCVIERLSPNEVRCATRMPKVLIVGPAASGKTVMARALSEAWNCPRWTPLRALLNRTDFDPQELVDFMDSKPVAVREPVTVVLDECILSGRCWRVCLDGQKKPPWYMELLKNRPDIGWIVCVQTLREVPEKILPYFDFVFVFKGSIMPRKDRRTLWKLRGCYFDKFQDFDTVLRTCCDSEYTALVQSRVPSKTQPHGVYWCKSAVSDYSRVEKKTYQSEEHHPQQPCVWGAYAATAGLSLLAGIAIFSELGLL